MRYAVRIDETPLHRFHATVPDVPGAAADGATPAEALDRIVNVMLMMVESMISAGEDVPTPNTAGDTTIEIPPRESEEIELYQALSEAILPGDEPTGTR